MQNLFQHKGTADISDLMHILHSKVSTQQGLFRHGKNYAICIPSIVCAIAVEVVLFSNRNVYNCSEIYCFSNQFAERSPDIGCVQQLMVVRLLVSRKIYAHVNEHSRFMRLSAHPEMSTPIPRWVLCTPCRAVRVNRLKENEMKYSHCVFFCCPQS